MCVGRRAYIFCVRTHHANARYVRIDILGGSMAPVILYECLPDVLPVVETALAAHGYIVTAPLQKSVGGGQALVMDAGSASVLVMYPVADKRAEIEVWGTARDATASFLEALPAKLHRRHAFGN